LSNLIYPARSAGGAEGYQVENSINCNMLGCLQRAFLDGGTEAYTISCWIKRGLVTGLDGIISTYSIGTRVGSSSEWWNEHEITSNGIIMTYIRIGGSIVYQGNTPGTYNDPSAWINIVISYDPDGSGESYIYVDGVLQDTSVAHGYNAMTSAGTKYICGLRSRLFTMSGAYYAEYAHIEGQILTPESFGEWHPDNDKVWRPIDVSGLDYSGVNSFHLDFKDATSSTTLGYDVSGNDNHFTPYLTITTDMQSTDTPSNNVCTLNSVDAGSGTLSGGNLSVTGTTDRVGTISVDNLKFAWIVNVTTGGSFGVMDTDSGTEYLADDAAGEVVEFELDVSAGTLNKIVDGGVSEVVASGMPVGTYTPLVKAACVCEFDITPTDGTFKALTSKNLPDVAIKNSQEYFDINLYTGNATARTIDTTNKADHVVIKNRDQADEWKVLDSVRGATKELSWDSTNIESTDANGLTSFGVETGFDLGTGAAGYNDSGEGFVSYNWTKGAIPGFDIVEYAGDGLAGHNIPHTLGVVPEMFMVKAVDRVASWYVYNKTVGATSSLVLDSPAAAISNIAWFNNTEPTSVQFTLGTAVSLNSSISNYVAYLWSSVPGFSKVFSYTGNGLADGPFVHMGFKPRFVMVKAVTQALSWWVTDWERGSSGGTGAERANPVGDSLVADGTGAEGSYNTSQDYLSNGWKLRWTSTSNNQSGVEYIGIAFAEYPFKLTGGGA